MTNRMIHDAINEYEIFYKYDLARAQIEIFRSLDQDTVVIDVKPFPDPEPAAGADAPAVEHRKPKPPGSKGEPAQARMVLAEMQAASLVVDEDLPHPEGTPPRGPNLHEQVYATLDDLCSKVSGTDWGPADAVPRSKKKRGVQGHDSKSPPGHEQGPADKGKGHGPEAGHPGKHEGGQHGHGAAR
jgi:hypothetical protein